MRIVVTIANPDPPEGRVTCDHGEEPSAFVGWLGLIRVLADAIASEANTSDVDGTGRRRGTVTLGRTTWISQAPAE